MKDEKFRNSVPATAVARPSSTLVIGLGNPILGDDGVGWKVVELINSSLATRHFSAETDCLSVGGLSLMERMVGYQRAILIDSMETGQSPEGSVKVFPLSSLSNPMAGHSASAHDTSLITALETAKAMGLPVPESVKIVAIEAKNVYDFSEELSPAIAEAVPLAVQSVINLLKTEEP
jgi:hydrogenase maturation protease